MQIYVYTCDVMKRLTRFFSVLMLVLLTVSIAAATTNENLPSKSEVSNLLDSADGKSASDVLNMVKEQLPAANADLWKKGDEEAISVYWTNPDSNAGYGATYFMDGEIGSSSDVCSFTLKEQYLGKMDSSKESDDSNDSEEQVEDTEEQDSETEDKVTILNKDDESSDTQEYTYESLKKALNNYDGSITCSSKNCATELSDSLSKDGWETSVESKSFTKYGTRYCVSVGTDDEGTVYVVLGA